MINERRLEFWVLRYAPKITTADGVNIGLLVVEPENEQFGEVRFASSWEKVLRQDPDADLEMLEAFRDEIQRLWKNHTNRNFLIEMMENSWSNSLQLSPKHDMIARELDREMSNLMTEYLS
jgi:hypothetical protein